MNWSSNASPRHIYWKIDSIDFLMNTYHHITNSIWHCSFLPSNSSARLDYSTLFANACTHHITAGAWILHNEITLDLSEIGFCCQQIRLPKSSLLNETDCLMLQGILIWLLRMYRIPSWANFQRHILTSWLQLLWQNKPFQTRRRTLMTKVCMRKSIHTGYVWMWVKSCI